MSKLYELTDAFVPEEITNSLPTDRPRVIINTAEFDKPKERSLLDNVGMAGVENKDKALSDISTTVGKVFDVGKAISEFDQKVTSDILNFPKKAYKNSEDLIKGIKNLIGLGEEERYQLWPEKMAKEALTAAGDIAKPNPYPEGSEQWHFYEGKRQEGMVPSAMSISALAGTGGLAGTGAKAGEVALGATPFLRPALKHKDRLYKGKPGQEHQDIIPKELYEDFRNKAMSGEDLAEYNFGFVNDKGHFLDREKALKYGIDTGLIDPHSGRFGALTTTLMADSSKPGVAIEAMKNVQPFYSAVEHTVKNIPQNKMTGEQWLGTIANKPGVKGEELDWTGLKGFLEENKGKPVTKAQIEEHLTNSKVELKEVNKFNKDNLKPDQEAINKWQPEWDRLVAKQRELRPANEQAGRDFENGKLSREDWVKINKPYRENEARMDDIHNRMISETASRANHSGDTKYSSYQLPGGENYREMLLTLPPSKEVWDQDLIYYMRKYPQVTSEIKTLEDVILAQKHNPAFKETTKGLSPEEVLATARASEKSASNPYKSSHWDEPNILAHIRMNDRDIGGKKSLHLEEIQSDWHQQGRDKGYKNNLSDTETAELKKLRAKIEDGTMNRDEAVRVAELENKKANYGGVPDAPFKKNWHELALKRMIREAAEKGYDRLSWTPGEAQAARYNLSKQVDSVWWSPEGGYFQASKNGHPVISKENVTKDQLPDLIGKEAADRLINKPTKISDLGKAKRNQLEGEDLKIGGEGMKGFYDQIIPKALEKLGKEHGIKVKQTALKDDPKYEIKKLRTNKDGIEIYGVYKDDGTFMADMSKSDALQYIKDMEKSYKPVMAHYIDIPQSLKDTALHKGFPLFSSTPGYMFVPVDGNPFENRK